MKRNLGAYWTYPVQAYPAMGADAPSQTLPDGTVITQRAEGGWYTPAGVRVVQVAGGAWVFDPTQITNGGAPGSGGPIVGASLPPVSPNLPAAKPPAYLQWPRRENAAGGLEVQFPDGDWALTGSVPTGPFSRAAFKHRGCWVVLDNDGGSETPVAGGTVVTVNAAGGTETATASCQQYTAATPSPGPTTAALAVAAGIGLALGYAYGGGFK